MVSCENDNITPGKSKHSTERSLPTCHHCGMVGHIRTTCGKLKFPRTWNKKNAPKMLKNIPRQNMFLHIADYPLKSLSLFAIIVGLAVTSDPSAHTYPCYWPNMVVWCFECCFSLQWVLLVFYIGNILVDKNTLCKGCFLNRIIGSIQSLLVIWTMSHFMLCVGYKVLEDVHEDSM